MITKKTTLKNEMSIGQRKAIMRLLEDTFASFDLDILLETLNLNRKQAQEILENGNSLSVHINDKIKESLKENSFINRDCGPTIKEFPITIPNNYIHEKQIDDFANRIKIIPVYYHYFNENLTSSKFGKASNQLEPGKAYIVKIIPILSTVTGEECLTILHNVNAFLVGGQGLTLVYDLAKEKLPKGKWVFSFDKKDSLWEDNNGDKKVPKLQALSQGNFEFNLGSFDQGIIAGGYLL